MSLGSGDKRKKKHIRFPTSHTSSKVISVLKEYLAKQTEAVKNLRSPHTTSLGVSGIYYVELPLGSVPLSVGVLNWYKTQEVISSISPSTSGNLQLT